MTKDSTIAEHYTRGDLLDAIRTSVTKLGKHESNMTVEDLGPVDEFHIGGRMATTRLLEQVEFSPHHHILDVGCGLGGAARFIASHYGSRVTGVDLTQEYIDVGRELNNWVGLDGRISLHQGSALAMPFADNQFDGALMIHVAMNIEDKAGLFAELFRVLKPDSTLAVYDIMRINDGELAYPVPWATVVETSVLSTPDQYRQMMVDAGFTVGIENNRGEFAVEFFSQMAARSKANGGPPPLGLHTLMGESTGMKLKNMVDNIAAGYIAPVELIAHK